MSIFRHAIVQRLAKAVNMSSGEGKCVAVTEVQSFVERCMIAVGTDPQHCKALSQVLSEADIRGHLTHGLHRLGNTSFRRKGFPFLSLIFSGIFFVLGVSEQYYPF